MSISQEDVLAVARLARLRLSSAEIEQFTLQLNSILEHMAALRSLSLEGVAAMGGAAEGAAPLRPDVLQADLLHISPAQLAVEWQDGFFTVPRLPALDADGQSSEMAR